MIFRNILLALYVASTAPAACHPASAKDCSIQQMNDKDQLTIALEYFSSGKYREALNILSRLDKKYKLNPRFKAYIGVCHYYEWNYKETCSYLDPIIEELEVYAPHERSVYYFACAESHFLLGEYEKAVPLYEKLLSVCYNSEKGDAYFRLGFCYMENGDWKKALADFEASLSHYEQFGYPANKQARVIQISKMINGCKKQIETSKQKDNN